LTLQGSKAKKDLVYFCIPSNESYIAIFELLIISIKLFSSNDAIDFLVITTDKYTDKIIKMFNSLDLPLNLYVVEESPSKLLIFNYAHINRYETILYIDTDVLVQGDLMTLFNINIEDKLYGIEECPIDNESHGGKLFNFNKINRNILGINCGILLFKNTDTMKSLFRSVIGHISMYKKARLNLPDAVEQPFINYYAILNNACDSQALKKHIFLTNHYIEGARFPVSPLSNKDIIINSFFDSSNKSDKLKLIKYHMDHLLKSYENIIPIFQYDDNNILRKQYAWDGGRIIFDKNSVLLTSWTRRGVYTWLNSHVIKAAWSGFDHILSFNDNYTSYVSVRLNDISLCYGLIDTSLKDTIPEHKVQPLLNEVGNKHLIYCCAFYNFGYLELYRMLLYTLKKYSNLDAIDLLIFTSSDFEPLINSFAESFKLNIKVKTFNFNTQHEAGCARLHIFEYENINDYSTILYLDTDIIVQGDISKLFNLQIADKLYAKKEYDFDGEGHGGWFFDFNTFYRKTPALNSGVLLFKNCAIIRSIFNEINTHIANLKKTGSLFPLCMDQSFIVFHFFRNNACDIDLISKYIYLAEFTQPPLLTDPNDLLLCHFVWPIGNTEHKKHRMLEHLALLNKSADV